jgi:hypothetical protein
MELAFTQKWTRGSKYRCNLSSHEKIPPELNENTTDLCLFVLSSQGERVEKGAKGISKDQDTNVERILCHTYKLRALLLVLWQQ